MKYSLKEKTATVLQQSKEKDAAKAVVAIRPMQKTHVPAVSRLEQETFSMPWSAQDFLDMIEREGALYVVALYEEQPIGVCGVINACGDGDICNVAVAKNWRERGVGRLLLSTLMEWGKEIGIVNYTLEVRVSNAAAIRLYESLGFQSEGIRPHFYEKPSEDAVIMWKRQAEDGQITMSKPEESCYTGSA
ncbi:MAG: ribosomal protein S18-alanine N-acetyltransferase [Lachnospiraceae bacterium]